jgi:hypothetical protein
MPSTESPEVLHRGGGRLAEVLDEISFEPGEKALHPPVGDVEREGAEGADSRLHRQGDSEEDGPKLGRHLFGSFIQAGDGFGPATGGDQVVDLLESAGVT